MDWWLLASSFGLVILGIAAFSALIAAVVWLEDELDFPVLASLMILVVIGIVTLAVYEQRGGFKAKPAEAPPQVQK